MDNGFDKNQILTGIRKFIYFANAKDLFYLSGDEEYLKNDNYNNGIIYVLENCAIEKNYNDNSDEYKAYRENFLKSCKILEEEDRNWLNMIEKTCKSKLGENFIPMILKRTNTAINLVKRPTSFNELDVRTLINILYNRDLRKGQHSIEVLERLMYYDNNNIIKVLYDEMEKTIKYLDKKQNYKLTFATIIGLIIAADKSTNFPQTLTDVYNIFYNEIFSVFSQATGHIILQVPAFYSFIYFNKMPNMFFKTFSIINENNSEMDFRIEIQNMLLERAKNDNWILEKYFDERTLQIICCFILTDCFFRNPIKTNEKSKFEFAFCLFLLIIKYLPKNILESAESFWENKLIDIFMVCCINNNTECKTMSANKMKESMTYNTPFEFDKNIVRSEVIEKLRKTDSLDFIIFIFVIANQIKDQELLDLINDKDEIKALAFDNACKLKDIIIKIKNSEIKELLQAIEDYFVYKNDNDANILVSILKKTHNDLGVSYNELLTYEIHNMINSNTKYKDIYNEVKKQLNLGGLDKKEKERIYELISTGEYVLKVMDISNYAPSINQYCSALERLLNEIIYMPYCLEVQNICLFKYNNRNFIRDDSVKEKYFGNTPHAMWTRNKKFSIISLGDLKILMKNISNDKERLDIFKKSTSRILKNIDIKSFFEKICDSIDKIKEDRDQSSHGELLNRARAEEIRAKVYKNDFNENLKPSDLILKIDKDLK